METYDVTVVGAGLAGLHTARLLAGSGLRVLLTDRKGRLDQGIHTTGIFVRKTLEDFDFLKDCFGPPIRDVTLYSPRRRALSLSSPHEEFRVGRMGLLYDWLLQKCIHAGVEWLPSTRYEGHTSARGTSILRLNRNGDTQLVETRYIVAADGASSRAAESLDLDRNVEWIVGVEEVLAGVPLAGSPSLHCFIDPKLAPGYIAWVVNDGEETHVGVGGYANRFDPSQALVEFRESLEPILDLRSAQVIDRRGGRIPVNGVLRRIGNAHGLLVGDAAGVVSPLTAGGFDGCLRLSTLAATIIEDFLRSGNANVLKAYSGEAFRSRFVSRLWMRRLIAHASHPALVESACALMRLPLVSSFAWHIFFGRRSFPDLDPTLRELPRALAAKGSC
jgi:flavin-dependent dehydrogenase